MSDVVRYTAGIPPLSTVKDPDTRRVLEALVSGWRTRNGDLKPDSNERFITKGELKELVESVVTNYFAADNQSSISNNGGSTIVDGVINDVKKYVDDLLDATDRDIMDSPLWTELGTRIQRIDLSLVAEQLARIAAVQKVADDLAAEAATRLGFDTVQGSKIASLESVTADQATKISGLTTRVSGAESTIINLQQTTASQATQLSQLSTRTSTAESKITSLETTTSTQAQTLTSLSTRVGTTESNISTLNTTTANQANSLTALSTTVNQKNRVFVQTSPPVSTTSYTLVTNDLWYDSDDGRKPYRWDGSSWVDASDTRIADAQAAITTEATTRANADNAITSTVTTQFSAVNTNIAALQTSTNTLSNNFASLSSTVTTLEATTGTNTAAIQTEALARTNADNDIYAKYSVKIDNNGHVAGYGLISTSNNSTPVSEFIVRADKFAVGTPSFPTDTPDYVQYVNYHVDVLVAFNASGQTNKAAYGLDHYTNVGQYQGRFLPQKGVPDYVAYVNYYTDLTNAFIASGQASKSGYGFNHYNTAGQFEDRYLPTVRGVVPFKVYTTGTLASDGVTMIPPGVYINDAYIGNGTIGTALIGDAAITSAKITNLAVDTIKIKDFAVSNFYFRTDGATSLVNLNPPESFPQSNWTLITSIPFTVSQAAAGAAGVTIKMFGLANWLSSGGGAGDFFVGIRFYGTTPGGGTFGPADLSFSAVSAPGGYATSTTTAAVLTAMGAGDFVAELRGAKNNIQGGVGNRLLEVLVLKK